MMSEKHSVQLSFLTEIRETTHNLQDTKRTKLYMGQQHDPCMAFYLNRVSISFCVSSRSESSSNIKNVYLMHYSVYVMF
jgi:hypothetical protein